MMRETEMLRMQAGMERPGKEIGAVAVADMVLGLGSSRWWCSEAGDAIVADPGYNNPQNHQKQLHATIFAPPVIRLVDDTRRDS